jgi:hypothetical protein
MRSKNKGLLVGIAVLVSAMVVLSGVNAFATPGNVDGIGDVDLRDVVLSLQVSAGIAPSSFIYKKYAVDDFKIGLEDAIHGLQIVAGLRDQAFFWYKDADGDGYSDGVRLIAFDRPFSTYFRESELIAISGDADDNNSDVHPDATPRWLPFDENQPADQSESVDVSVPTETGEEIVIEYSIPGMETIELPEDGQIFNILNIDGSGYTDDVGKPRLPFVSRYVAVPQGAVVGKEVIHSTFRDIEGYRVSPAQTRPIDTIDAPTPPFTIDAEIYATDDLYPSEIVQIEGPVVIRGVSTLIVRIYPVQYNPARDMLRIYSEIKIRLTYSGGTRATRSRRLRSPAFDQMLGRLVLNPDLLFSGGSARAAHDEGNSLLIIAHPNFLDAANTLKDWKIKKGIHTEVRTTNQTGSTAASIRNYIQNAYDTWFTPPTYVLLIGDAEYIPTHYLTTHPETSRNQGRTGTDLYYSTVDGDDYFPDINLGRLSVDTLTQANKRVDDIISYEKAVVTDASFYNSVAIAAYFQHGGGGRAERRFSQTSEDLALFFADPEYLGMYSVDRIYFTGSSVVPASWSTTGWNFGGGPAGNPGDPIPSYLQKPGFQWNGNRFDISSSISDGRFLMVHRDHGAAWGWGDPRYNIGDVQALTNGNKLPVVWSINCQTGWFDNETDDPSTETNADAVHFSEAWERNTSGGAVGLIAATRISYSGDNDRLVWGWMDAIWPGFESYNPSNTPFDDPVYEMGPVLNYGKYYYAGKHSDSIWRKTSFEAFHWFGDPTMQIWTDVPRSLGVSHQSSLPQGATSISVAVDQIGALVCVSKNGEILSRQLSAGGETLLSWSVPLAQGDVIHVTATKHNFRPYEGNVTGSVSCTYAIFPESRSIAASGGSGSISVTAPAGCAWTAASDENWISVTSGASGNGNGTVSYSVAANPNAEPRPGTLTVAGRTVTVEQAGYAGPVEDPPVVFVPPTQVFSREDARSGILITLFVRDDIDPDTLRVSASSALGDDVIQNRDIVQPAEGSQSPYIPRPGQVQPPAAYSGFNWVVFYSPRPNEFHSFNEYSPISVSVFGSPGVGHSQLYSVNVGSMNDAPLLREGLDPVGFQVDENRYAGTIDCGTVWENAADPPGFLLSDWIDPVIVDVDDGNSTGVAIIGIDVGGGGTWQYDLGAGWMDIGAVSPESALLLASSAQLRFLPQGQWSQDQNEATLEFRAWDQTDGNASGTTGINTVPSPRPSFPGDTAVFSKATGVLRVSVTPLGTRLRSSIWTTTTMAAPFQNLQPDPGAPKTLGPAISMSSSLRTATAGP